MDKYLYLENIKHHTGYVSYWEGDMATRNINIYVGIIFIILIFYNPMAILSEKYNFEAFSSSLTIYGVYRIIDRYITLAADVDFQGGAVVAYIIASPGKLLQPAVEILGRFIDILFPFMILSGILYLVVAPLAKIGAIAGLIGIALREVRKRLFPSDARFAFAGRLSEALVKIAVISSLVVPGSYSAGYLIGTRITSSTWDSAYAKFAGFEAETGLQEADSASGETSVPVTTAGDHPAATSEDKSILGGLSDWVQEKAGAAVDGSSDIIKSAGGEAVGVLRKVSSISGIIWDVVDSSTSLLVAYIIRTTILPVSIGWTLLWLLRQMYPRATTQIVDSAPKPDPLLRNE